MAIKRQDLSYDGMAATIGRIRRVLRPLRACGWHSVDEARWSAYYGFPSDGVRHRFGYFDSGGYRLAAHFVEPPSPKGTVVVLHGYLDHAGLMARPARTFAGLGYAVALYDMPGHGLSSGEPGHIDDFSTYARVLTDFLGLCREELPGPFHLVAHSTGGAAAVQYLLQTPEPDLDRVVLVAPLIRSYAWGWSKFGASLAAPFVSCVPRVFRRCSTDKDFLRFARYEDPVAPKQRRVPLSWFRSLKRWNESLAEAAPCPFPLLALQGTEDTVVAGRYNTAFIRQKFPAAAVRAVCGGDHQLLNEAPPCGDEVYRAIARYLERGLS